MRINLFLIKVFPGVTKQHLKSIQVVNLRNFDFCCEPRINWQASSVPVKFKVAVKAMLRNIVVVFVCNVPYSKV